MFFNKKPKEEKCWNCNSSVNDKFNFCPVCGESLVDEEKEARDFGMLGKNDFSKPRAKEPKSFSPFGITDKFINSIMNSMMKSFDRQFKEADFSKINEFENANIEHLPNGIKIKIGVPSQKQQKPKQQAKKKEISEEQIERMSKLPRQEAKSRIRRLSDKIVYELDASGIESPDDIFISKLESGYEIKAIGKKKVYINTLPINLPLKKYAIEDNKLLFEFKTEK